jgi:hypothetical protein
MAIGLALRGGIECLDGTYFIEGKRLLEDLPEWSWPQHMAEKGVGGYR